MGRLQQLRFCSVLQFFACLLIIFGAEIAAGVFGFINKEQVRLFIFHIRLICALDSQKYYNLLIFVIVFQQQIVEEVQKFYSSSITDTPDDNSTTITLMYHNVVSKTLPTFIHNVVAVRVIDLF